MAMAVVVVGGVAGVFVFRRIVMAAAATGMMWRGGMGMGMRVRMGGHDVLDLIGVFEIGYKARNKEMYM